MAAGGHVSSRVVDNTNRATEGVNTTSSGQTVVTSPGAGATTEEEMGEVNTTGPQPVAPNVTVEGNVTIHRNQTNNGSMTEADEKAWEEYEQELGHAFDEAIQEYQEEEKVWDEVYDYIEDDMKHKDKDDKNTNLSGRIPNFQTKNTLIAVAIIGAVMLMMVSVWCYRKRRAADSQSAYRQLAEDGSLEKQPLAYHDNISSYVEWCYWMNTAPSVQCSFNTLFRLTAEQS